MSYRGTANAGTKIPPVLPAAGRPNSHCSRCGGGQGNPGQRQKALQVVVLPSKVGGRLERTFDDFDRSAPVADRKIPPGRSEGSGRYAVGVRVAGYDLT